MEKTASLLRYKPPLQNYHNSSTLVYYLSHCATDGMGGLMHVMGHRQIDACPGFDIMGVDPYSILKRRDGLYLDW